MLQSIRVIYQKINAEIDISDNLETIFGVLFGERFFRREVFIRKEVFILYEGFFGVRFFRIFFFRKGVFSDGDFSERA